MSSNRNIGFAVLNTEYLVFQKILYYFFKFLLKIKAVNKFIEVLIQLEKYAVPSLYDEKSYPDRPKHSLDQNSYIASLWSKFFSLCVLAVLLVHSIPAAFGPCQ
jgi:hypothetical protein